MNAVRIRISSLEARVNGGASLLALIGRLHAPIECSQALERPALEALAEEGELVFNGHDFVQRRMALSSTATLAALQVSRTICDALVGVHEPLVIASGAALERGGRVLAIVSRETGVGKTTLALQLLSRGWRIVSDDRILIDRSTREVLPYHRLLTVGSSAIPFLPRMFRRALEVSPWYYEPDALEVVYVGVDPGLACGKGVWSLGGALESVLVARRATDGAASIETIAAHEAFIPSVRLAELLRDGAAGLAALNIGTPTVTADVVEAWVDSEASRRRDIGRPA